MFELLGVAGTGFRRGTLVCNDDWPLQGVTRPLLLPPASGSPVAPAKGQSWAERADREGVGRPAPPGNLVTGALATERGRDLGRKSEAGGYVSREFLLRANSESGYLGPLAASGCAGHRGPRRPWRTWTPFSPRHGDLSAAGAAAADGGQDQKPALVGGGLSAAGKGIGGRGGPAARPPPAGPRSAAPNLARTELQIFALTSPAPQPPPFF